jgi:hypothetical protein
MMVEILEKVEIPLAVAPVEFPLQFSLVLAMFWCFSVSAALCPRKPQEVLYIGIFRSN